MRYYFISFVYSVSDAVYGYANATWDTAQPIARGADLDAFVSDVLDKNPIWRSVTVLNIVRLPV